MTSPDDLSTPLILADRRRVAANVRSMQAVCDAHGVELRPHIKTHKMVALAKMQLEAGARGLTCAKLGEAEAMLPSGVRSLFVAHSLVDARQAPRVAALAEQVPDLRLAVTSAVQAEALAALLARAGRKLTVMMAVDTGLGREGARDQDSALRLAATIARFPHLELGGIYTHEGYFYGVSREEQVTRLNALLDRLLSVRDAIDPALPLWPGCSVSARWLAQTGRVNAVRPGAYVFGDLSLTRGCGIMSPDEVALHVLATVVDRPEPGLALIDAGSKTFSSDRTADGIHALSADGRALAVTRVNEEHGYVTGTEADTLRVGDRLRLVPAHVCTVINLTDEVFATEGETVVDTWKVDARGRTR